jgi:hypothetical protein
MARFSAQKMPSSNMSAPSSTAGSPVSSQDTPWMQNLRAFISSSTGNVKLPPRAVQTPPPGQTVAAELGEKTPRENTFSLDGDSGSQGHTPKHEDEKTQDRYDGDSDEEPSFGVAPCDLSISIRECLLACAVIVIFLSFTFHSFHTNNIYRDHYSRCVSRLA